MHYAYFGRDSVNYKSIHRIETYNNNILNCKKQNPDVLKCKHNI